MAEQISLNSKQPRRVFPQNEWIEGLSDYNKIGGAYLWARGVDYRSEPSQLKLLPQGLAEGQGIFVDLGKFGEQVVGRTVSLNNQTNLISNNSFETNTTGWTLGTGFTRANDDAYLGSWSIKQATASGTAKFTTASGSGIPVTAYADYQLVFYMKVAVTSGAAPQLQVLGGSLSGPNLLSSAVSLGATSGVWQQVSVSFNALQYTSVFIVIGNQGGNITAHYDYFSLYQINSIACYVIGNAGNLYKRYSNATWTKFASVTNSHGNGLGYYGEDDYLYFTGDISLGRYGPISSGTPKFVNDYLTSAGGIPTNTNSTLLIAADSQYWKKTSPTSNVEITGDIAIEAFIKPTSLPAVGNSMTIAGLWNENTNNRAWKLDLYGISGYFGNGQDNALTVTVNTTESPIDSACSGTISTTTLFATNASFTVGQLILIMQMQGSGAGTWQITTIQGYTSGQITTQDPLSISYNSSGNNTAQVRVLPQYTSVTINPGVTYSPKAWNGSTGGILAFFANGQVTVSGSIVADSLGFRNNVLTGGVAQGEGTGGSPTFSTVADGNGGGGGTNAPDSGHVEGGGGGGGANASGATGGQQPPSQAAPGAPGNAVGAADLTTMCLGGAGGYGGGGFSNGSARAGGNGGGIIFINAVGITITGTITSNGSGGTSSNDRGGAGGGGAGGSINLKAQTAILGGANVQAVGAGGGSANDGNAGGTGSPGIIALHYLTSFSGTTNPTVDAIQDNTLVTSTVIQARLGISNDGTSFEYLTQNLKTITVGQWERISVSWAAAQATASFYESGSLVGISIGSKTAIYGAGSADFAVGANVGASVYQNFLDSEVNDVRVWNAQQSQAQISFNMVLNLNGSATNLVGNWFTTATGNDEFSSSPNNLAAQGTPNAGFVTDVPFPGATTRGDVDQTGGNTGSTYALPTTLTEGQKQSFVPSFDPQKSLQINIGAKGTGDWTLVVHDGLNNIVAQMTVTNANLPATGLYEFIYPQVFRPVKGATYHFHLYSTVNDGTVVSTNSNDATTIQFTTYYQFLVNDTEYHPIMQMGSNLGIGNERYVALLSAAGGDGIGIYNGQGYNPHRLSLPAGWRVRCFALWKGFYAIGCWRGTTIKDFDQGIVFIWDGYSATYNDFFFVPQGGVNAMWGENGILYIIAGYQGDLLEYTGDLMAEYGYDIVNKAKRIPKLGLGNTMEVTPGAITYYGSLLRINASYNATGSTLERGTYTWGSFYSHDPKSLSFDYPISTGNRGATVSMGLLLPVGGSLLSFYQDGTSYGVNNINPTNAPQTTGTIEGLLTDLGSVYHPKELLTVRANHLPLVAGANVDVKYKIDYEASWHNLGITNQKVGDIDTRYPLQAVNNKTQLQNQYHAVQIAIDLYASQGISPTIIETGNFSDLLVTEGDEAPV